MRKLDKTTGIKAILVAVGSFLVISLIHGYRKEINAQREQLLAANLELTALRKFLSETQSPIAARNYDQSSYLGNGIGLEEKSPPISNNKRVLEEVEINAQIANVILDQDENLHRLAQQKWALDSRYADLFAQLHLPSDKLDIIKSLLAEKLVSASDARLLARSQKITDDVKISKLVQDATSIVDKDIQTTLGDSNYNQYLHYEESIPDRIMAKQLVTRLSYTDTPLNNIQIEKVIEALYEARNAQKNQESITFSNPSVYFTLQQTLSPKQAEILNQLCIDEKDILAQRHKHNN